MKIPLRTERSFAAYVIFNFLTLGLYGLVQVSHMSNEINLIASEHDGKTFGYVYVLQGEKKQIPNGFHWDVTDQRHMLNVVPILEEQTELSVELLKTLTN